MKNPKDYKLIITQYTNNYNKYLAAEPPYKASKKASNLIDNSILNPDYLSQMTTYLGHLPIIRNDKGLLSPTLILREIAGTQLEAALKIAYLFPRSKFIKGMTSNSTLGSLTPLAMYALKRDEGIMYEEWDKEDEHINRFLGKSLKNVYLASDVPKEQCVELRSGFNELHKYPFKNSYIVDSITLNKIQAILLAQVWLANVQFRNTESMILDPKNWDNVPDAFDAYIEPEKPAIEKPVKKPIDDWLDW